jgi:hypothetical protein
MPQTNAEKYDVDKSIGNLTAVANVSSPSVNKFVALCAIVPNGNTLVVVRIAVTETETVPVLTDRLEMLVVVEAISGIKAAPADAAFGSPFSRATFCTDELSPWKSPITSETVLPRNA